MVVAGSYDEYRPVRVFEDKAAAEAYAVEYNSEVSWTDEDDKARVEEIDFVPAREMKMIEYSTVGGEQQ